MADETNGARELLQIAYGAVVDSAEMAIELAEVLVRRGFGDDCLKAQQPLSARDAGEYWAVEGAPDASQKATGLGPVKIEIKKADASLASLYFELSRELQAKLQRGGRPKDIP